jgi:hypothetical protein
MRRCARYVHRSPLSSLSSSPPPLSGSCRTYCPAAAPHRSQVRGQSQRTAGDVNAAVRCKQTRSHVTQLVFHCNFLNFFYSYGCKWVRSLQNSVGDLQDDKVTCDVWRDMRSCRKANACCRSTCWWGSWRRWRSNCLRSDATALGSCCASYLRKRKCQSCWGRSL